MDQEIREYFEQFKETTNELMLSMSLCDYIIKNLTPEEKVLFCLRVVRSKTFYEISDTMGTTYRLAQSSYQKLSDKIWGATRGYLHMKDKADVEIGNEFFNYEDRIIFYNNSCLDSAFLEDGIFDITITSPPYNVGINYGEYEDTLDYNVYLDWSKQWMERVLALTKDDGRLCVNVPIDCCYKDAERATFVDITNCARDVGWRYHGTIIWHKHHVAARGVVGTRYSAKAPITNHQSEAIIIFYNKTWEKTSGSGVSSITKDEFWKLTNGTWSFPGQPKQAVNHPAPFPVTLPSNCLKMFSYVDDLVLDPFLGSGTTAVASAQLGRRCIGFDIDTNYLETAKRRIMSEEAVSQQSMFSAKEVYKQCELFEQEN